MRAEPEYRVVRDPIFLVTVAFFAPLTTVLPALMGQQQLMPIMQTLALVAFLAVALHHRDMRQAVFVMAIWVGIQLAIVMLLGAFFPATVEQAIPDGFALRTGVVEWIYADINPPVSVQATPIARLLEIVAVIGGTLFTGGLIGGWILVRTINQVGFSIGVLLGEVEDILLLVAFLPWSLLRIAGYAGLVLLLAEPLWSRNWSFGFYSEHRKRLFYVTIALLLTSLVLEAFLPGFWPSLFR